MSQQQMPVALDPLDFSLHGSRLIEASAGTGKTFTIALLYVRLVSDHGGENTFGRPLSPSKTLVVTSTDAAIQELRKHIRSRFGETARCFAEPQECYDGLLAALRQQHPTERWLDCACPLRLAVEWMDEATVPTIHSWCYRMLRGHAFDSGSLFTQGLETDQSELLVEVAWDYWWCNFYGLTALAAQAAASCYSGPETPGKVLQPLLARQDADSRHADQAPSALESLAALLEQGGDWYRQFDQLDAQAHAARRAARVELEALPRDLCPYLNGNSCHGKDSDETFDAWLQVLADWSEGGEQPANSGKFGQIRIKLTAKRMAPEHAAPRVIDTWAAHQEERPDLVPHLLLHALGKVGRELEVEKQRRTEIGFDDLLNRLDRALQRSGGERLVQLIREQFLAALVDEFQDTDPVQYRISERIYRIAADPDEPQARGTGLFMIGDPKQATCASRGADIHTYLRVCEATRGRHYTLGKNFRSTVAMVVAANRCFVSAEECPHGTFRFIHEGLENPVPFHVVGAQGCAEHLPIDGVEAPAMTSWSLDAEAGVLGFAVHHQEMAERSASAIRRWLSLADLGRIGFADEQGGWYALRPADIAVPVRGRAEAGAIRSALAARRLASAYLSDCGSVFDSQEAADLLHWLRAYVDPGVDILP